jgi:hypothetical protein
MGKLEKIWGDLFSCISETAQVAMTMWLNFCIFLFFVWY